MTVILGTPGAALTTSDLDPDLQQLGIEGERKGAAALEAVLGSSNAVLAHSLRIPGHKGDIDHLILAGTKVVIVDSKLWAGRHLQVESSTATKIELSRDGESFAGGSIALPRQMQQWSDYLGVPKASVYSVLLVPRHGVTFTPEREAGVVFATLDTIEKTLRELLGSDANVSPPPYVLKPAQRAVQVAPASLEKPKVPLAPLLAAAVIAVATFFPAAPALSGIAAALVVLLTLVSWDRTRRVEPSQDKHSKRAHLVFRLHLVTAAVSIVGVLSRFLA